MAWDVARLHERLDVLRAQQSNPVDLVIGNALHRAGRAVVADVVDHGLHLDNSPSAEPGADLVDLQQRRHHDAAGCKLLYLESPTNPTLKIVDIARLAAAARAAGALLAAGGLYSTLYETQFRAEAQAT